MNPYHAKILKERDHLNAAKERLWIQLHGAPEAKKPLRPYVPINRLNDSDIYKQSVEKARKIPNRQLEELVEKRELPKRLGFDNDTSLSKNRKQHSILLGAGKEKFQLKASLDVMREILETGNLRGGTRSREGPIAYMLHIAGIIEMKPLQSGRREFKVKDKERLKRSLDERRIVW